MDGPTFDTKQYEHYYLRQEKIDSLEVEDEATRDGLLANVTKVVENEGLPPLLKRDFISFPEEGGSNGHPKMRLMQWNILAQGL